MRVITPFNYRPQTNCCFSRIFQPKQQRQIKCTKKNLKQQLNLIIEGNQHILGTFGKSDQNTRRSTLKPNISSSNLVITPRKTQTIRAHSLPKSPKPVLTSKSIFEINNKQAFQNVKKLPSLRSYHSLDTKHKPKIQFQRKILSSQAYVPRILKHPQNTNNFEQSIVVEFIPSNFQQIPINQQGAQRSKIISLWKNIKNSLVCQTQTQPSPNKASYQLSFFKKIPCSQMSSQYAISRNISQDVIQNPE